MVPTPLNSREALALRSWTGLEKLQQNRRRPITRQARPARVVDERTSAILHGDQRLQQLGSELEESFSYTSSPSQVLSRKSKESPRTYQKPGHTSSAPRRGKPKGPPRQAKKQREIRLKDEDYLRTSMPIPTASDYPELPPEIFEHPKSALLDAFGGAKRLSSSLSMIEGDQAFRCVLRFTLNEEKVVCIGESQSKVL